MAPTTHRSLIVALAALTACSFDPGSPPGRPPPNADPLLGCSGTCHGDEASIAPPRDTQGQTATSSRSVGAHRSHLDASPLWYKKLACSACHQVPAAIDAAGHMDSALPAELVFGALARTGGQNPSWNGTTCTNVYCHGATLPGGRLTQPSWTVLDGSQSECGTCHGFPPPDPHPQDMDCGTCHPTIQPGTMTFLDPDSHINGTLETTQDTQPCDNCHGSDGVAAPPLDLDGDTDPTAPGVGAHRSHLGASTRHRELFCSQCHVVPTSIASPGHMDGDNQAELTFDGLNPDGEYARGSATCSQLYCHGNGWNVLGELQWTAPTSLGCNGCHEDGSDQRGRNMSGEHDRHLRANILCADCHAQVVDQTMNIIGANLHVNGLYEIDIASGGTWNGAANARRCTNLACHGDESWDGDDD